MDTKQVIEEMELDQGYDQFIGIGHSFGATSMYVNDKSCSHIVTLTCHIIGFCWNSFTQIRLMDYA